MTAAERAFPSSTGSPSWLDIAVNVFNSQASRWDTQACGGGIRQQIMPSSDGFNYKDSLTNGLFFLHASRLYRFTGNKTYGDWAIKAYDWMEQTSLYSNGYIYEGASTTSNCSIVDKVSFTANAVSFPVRPQFVYSFVAVLKSADYANCHHSFKYSKSANHILTCRRVSLHMDQQYYTP
jgi:hypothetical protein